MKAKKIMALLAAAAVIMAAGCSDTSNSSDSTSSGTSESVSSEGTASAAETGETVETAETGETGTEENTASVLTAGIPEDKVIASCTTAEGMDITFGEFLKEYKYYMENYGYTDDTSADNMLLLQQQRERIINYLINEQIMKVKFEELLPAFTEEELAEIKENGEKMIAEMKQTCKEAITSMSIEKYSDEELDKLADEAFSDLLTTCAITEQYFHDWAYVTAVQDKLVEYVNKDTTLDYSEAETQAQNVIDGAKSSYESDPASYDGNSYASLYIPEGSIYIEQIVLKLPDAEISEINTLRDSGDDEGADALRAEKLKSLDEKLAEVQGKIDGGEDFAALMKEYSDDSDTSAKYLITPGSQIYVDGFAEAAMAITEVGGMTTFGSDYGYHIIRNLGTAEVDPEERKEMTQAIYDYLLSNYKAVNFSAAIREWRGEYSYTIDRDTLLLAEETEASDTSADNAG
ncbi:MAG: peptidylprolyl isomerase [Oscillospiraceae bacterium]